ncbi:MAG: hypothetical protein WDM81_20685 [Rhizomicrobium sp.]
MVQAPRHSTSVQESMPSAVGVICAGPISFLQTAITSSEPRSVQGGVVQTWRWNLPTGARLNIV